MELPTPVEIVQKLVRVGRYSGQEGDTAQVVCQLMETLGYDAIEKTDCGSIIGWFGPKDAPMQVLFDGHIDIATVAGKWSFDPFCAEIRDGQMLGRGTTDMKGGLGAALYAVAQYAHTHTLTTRIAVSATVMEETIEGLGLEDVLAQYQPQSVVICEPSELAVMKGQKGRMELMLTVQGKSAHASNPEVGINSMMLAAKALLSIEALAPPSHPILGEGILVPTDIITSPYPSISAVPEKTFVRFDRRTLPGETEEGVIEEISQAVRASGVTDFTLAVVESPFETYTGISYTRGVSLPPWSISEDAPLFQAMYRGAQRVLGREPTVSAWKCCTNGSESAGKRNIPTIGMGPGSIAQAHITDEYISVQEIVDVAEIYMAFLEECLN